MSEKNKKEMRLIDILNLFDKGVYVFICEEDDENVMCSGRARNIFQGISENYNVKQIKPICKIFKRANAEITEPGVSIIVEHK